jgi:hypothetical protein
MAAETTASSTTSVSQMPERAPSPQATLLARPEDSSRHTKTVAVLGAAYGGTRAAQILAQGLPEGWRVLLIDRNRSVSYDLICITRGFHHYFSFILAT